MTSVPSMMPAECPADLGHLPIDLTPTERAVLLVLAAPRPTRGQFLTGRRTLKRLLQPLRFAGEALGLGPEARRVVVRSILRAIQETGRAYGTWDTQTWVTAAQSAGHLRANVLAVACHLGCLSTADALTLGGYATRFARRLFGQAAFDREVDRVVRYLQAVGYARTSVNSNTLPSALARLLLLAGCPRLEALTVDLIEEAHRQAPAGNERRTAYVTLSRALHGMGLLPRPIAKRLYPRDALEGVDPLWAEWCLRWLNTATLAPKTKKIVYYSTLKAGRWLAQNRPAVRSPDDWTREVALAYTSAVNGFAVGDLSSPIAHLERRRGMPISASSKDHLLVTLRIFFRDCQEWGWAQRRFDPGRAFATPRGVKALISPKPRVIADDVWARLLWAGVDLAAGDLSVVGGVDGTRPSGLMYPFPLVKALAITWLFAGLRSDEIMRLQVGCIRWQRHDGGPAAAQAPEAGATCLLDIPVHKTGESYTKPVDPLVGEAIAAWEMQRPNQPLQIDHKTGERAEILFCWRGRPVPNRYLNGSLIPLLCRKAGVPLCDARGRITSHRARSTIASQLYNAKEPMTLFELQAWLGHRSPATTQHYARITPTTLAKAYADANYFARNLRAIEVLIDRDAVKGAAAASGEPWRYYDLGHGLCSYEFFDQCPHRMACPGCDFYNPKGSSSEQLLEAKSNLLRLLQEVPLTEDERAAVDGDLLALKNLLARLADRPTPSGQTPKELNKCTQCQS